MHWQISHNKVKQAVNKIPKICRAKKIILFGSYPQDRVHANSDLDILVIVDDAVKNPRQESVRIRRELRNISMPMDILVVTLSNFQKFNQTPGLIYQEALRHGKTVYEAA